MSVRSEKAAAPTNPLAALDGGDATATAAPEALAEGNSFNVANPDHPIERNVVVSIKATLNDFCLQKTRGTWAPTQEALRSIFQQKRFTSLDGSAESMGDLKAVVLHNMELNHVKSTFPMCKCLAPLLKISFRVLRLPFRLLTPHTCIATPQPSVRASLASTTAPSRPPERPSARLVSTRMP